MWNLRWFFLALCWPPGRRRLLVAALLLAVGRLASAQTTSEALNRSFYFVNRSAEATELFNTNRPQEALTIFQELAGAYADLDEDGYVALSIGDCLTALGRYDQARKAYAGVASTRPDLSSKVDERLVDAEVLSGAIGDDALNKLRHLAGAADGDAFKGRTRLGWALEKKAHVLLKEAAEVFRAAAQTAWFQKEDHSSINHALLLEEINQDLASLMAQTEALYGSRSLQQRVQEAEEQRTKIHTARQRAEYVLRAPDGKRYEFQMRQDPAGVAETLVNGRALELTEDERRILQRHQDRINAILIQAANRIHDK